MRLLETPWHVFGILLIITLGLAMAILVGRRFGLRRRRTSFLYFWHTGFCLLYVLYVLENGGDALGYYQEALFFNEWKLGTAAVSVIAAPFVHWLGLPFFGVNLVFNFFGVVGLLAFYGGLRSELVDRPRWVRRLAYLVVLLPSVSFWSSGLGKDSLAFMATGLAFWAALNLRSRATLMCVAIGTMLVVRPHMAGILLLAVGASVTFGSEVSLKRRLVFALLILSASVILIPFALNYAGLGSADSVSEVNDYIEQRQGYNQVGGGSIDISSMSPLMRAFTYLFRPLPFEAHSFAALAASLDNLLLLLLAVLGCWGILSRRKTPSRPSRIFMWCYVVACLGILSMTTANLGISVRQKWMFVPMLVYLLLSVTGRSRDRAALANGLPTPVVDRNVASWNS
ncbi:hypothetical protein ABL850_09845 [Variovorax paradoxus]|jgi:hypothetical protein|uniref:hypothetical protein n=1 Tax=Variovorax paradoxus TaxID=34073 RepID=UPI0003F65246